MIKLFTLEKLSASASDAVYKICLTLDAYGFSEEDRQSFEGFDALLTAASFAVEDGDDVILAAEPADYLTLKEKLLSKLMLEGVSMPSVAERIAQNHDGETDFDMRAHCLEPKGSVTHLTTDGLFSGYTAAVQNGSLTLMPLDFERIDAVLDSFIALLFAPQGAAPAAPAAAPQAPVVMQAEADTELLAPVARMVETLRGSEKRLGLALGGATQQILGLQGGVEHLTDAVDFIDVSPDPEAPADPQETQTAQVIREARQAREDANADFGAAISPLYEAETDDGTQYYAFVAFADSEGAKAKKINTMNPNDAPLLPGHCVSVLCDTVCRKIDGERTLNELSADDGKKDGKKLSKGVIAFAVVILLVAVLTPILLLNHFMKDNPTTEPSSQTDPSAYSSTVPTSETTLPADNYLPAEPGASEVTAAPTTTVAPSTSGTFTFYVFGYGHGVGLSQHGAEYLSSLGWNYAQILANYYYGTTLVKGDTYPPTINYAGTDYETVEYLASCLESEMSSAFSREALKAQAVALYTFAKYNGFKLNADANAHGKTPSDICRQVAQEVKNEGLYIAYQGKTALTPFHSISAGKTTSYFNVWGGSNLPYLNGGRPSYGDYNVSDFKSTYTISSDEFRTIAQNKLGVTLSGDPATWITIQSHDQAISSDIGYVSKLTVGGRELTGNEFRGKVMEGKIRSHCFVLSYTPDSQPVDMSTPTTSAFQ